MASKFLPPGTTTATRTGATPVKKEVLYDNDLDCLFYGDGVTVGGNRLNGVSGVTTVGTGTYTLLASDNKKLIRFTAVCTVTIPSGLPDNFECILFNASTGTVTIVAGGGVTTESDGLLLETQYTAASIFHAGSELYLAMGALT